MNLSRFPGGGDSGVSQIILDVVPSLKTFEYIIIKFVLQENQAPYKDI